MNPYFCYLISFSIALLTYWLNWSELYPDLSGPLLLFLLSMMAMMTLAGTRWKDWMKLKTFQPVNVGHNPVWITLFIFLLWTLDFLYEGGIPLLKILWGQPYNYRLFGVPTLHVITVTFASFYTIFLFHLYLSDKKGLVLFLFLVNLSAAILIYSRAMLLFNLTACSVIYLFSIPKMHLRSLAIFLGGIVVLAYLFGVQGTLRSSREAQHPYDNALFFDVGHPTESFLRGPVPHEFFWSYMYWSSPLANLQKNVNEADHSRLTWRRFGEMLNNEFLMDFLSKRINWLTNTEREGQREIPGPFNVSTIYSRSFSYLQWWGMAFMGLFILVLPALCLAVLKPSPYYITGIAILCTIFFFMFYDNTIRFTGLSFQLVYPITMGWLWNRYPAIKHLRGKIFQHGNLTKIVRFD